MTNEKKIVARAILLTIILLLVIAAGGAIYFEKMHLATERRYSVPAATSESETDANSKVNDSLIAAGWKVYNNKSDKFVESN